MKCQHCGGEVNTKTMVCPYCDSKIEVEEKKQSSQTLNNVNVKRTKKVNHTTIALTVIFAVIFITVIAFFVITFASFIMIGVPVSGALVYELEQQSQEVEQQQEQEQEILTDRLPKSATDIVGEMYDCTTKGVVTIYYDNRFCSDVQILDSAFIDWLSDEGIDPTGMKIMFSTDENRDITDVYIEEQDDFVVMYQEGNTYVAFVEDVEEIITFETDMELEVDTWYTGYFHYPDKEFHSAIASDCYESYGEWSYLCKEKATPTEHCAISNKEVMVYKLLIGDDWYYCSKDTYDTVSEGDDLRDDYTFVLAEPYVYK